MAIADAGIADAQAFEAELINHASSRGSGRVLEDAAGAFLPHGLAGAPFFIADANSLNYFTVRFGGKTQRHCEHHIIRRKRSVTVFKGNLSTPEDFYPAPGGAIDLHLLHVAPDLRAVRAGVHAKSSANRAGNTNKPLHPAKIVFRAERNGST